MQLSPVILYISCLAAVVALLIQCDVFAGYRSERTRLTLADGSTVLADIVGLSVIRLGQARKTKIRAYKSDGEPAWESGTGYRCMIVERCNNGFYELKRT